MFNNWPKNLNLELSTLCNAACPQCARYLDDDEENGIIENPEVIHSSMTLATLSACLDPDWVRQAKHVKFEGTHGEPSLAQDCFKIMAWFRELNPEITFAFHTNASTRNEEWWSNLATFFQYHPERLSQVTFSLDGLEDTNHIYRRRTVWKKIMLNAKAFIAAGGVAVWDMIIFEHNEHQVLKVRKLAKEMGFYSFRTKISQRNLSRPIQWLKQPKYFKQSSGSGTVKIDCIGQSSDELFLNANGLYMPCCFINENAWGPATPTHRKEIETVLGDFSKFHSMHGLENALGLFREVSGRWETNPMEICKNMCGSGSWPHRTQQRNTWENWPDTFQVKWKNQLLPKDC